MPKHETPASRFGVQPARSAAASVGAASAGAGLAFDSDRSLQLAATERPRRSTNAVATWNRADFIEAHCCTSDLHLATRPSSQMNPVSARPDRPNANSTITNPICISWRRGKRIHSGGVKPTRWWSNFRRPRITAGESGPVFEVRPQVHDTRKAGLVSSLIATAREKGFVAYVGDGQEPTAGGARLRGGAALPAHYKSRYRVRYRRGATNPLRPKVVKAAAESEKKTEWRRRESNPGPKVLKGGPYVRVRRIWFRVRLCPPTGPALASSS